jgi:hypothetical protein
MAQLPTPTVKVKLFTAFTSGCFQCFFRAFLCPSTRGKNAAHRLRLVFTGSVETHTAPDGSATGAPFSNRVFFGCWVLLTLAYVGNGERRLPVGGVPTPIETGAIGA